MRQKIIFAITVIVVSLLMAGAAGAGTTLNIWPGKAPGSEHWSWQEQDFPDTPMGAIVENVVTPTLTAYLPAPDKATDTGVIIAPGGACIALVMDKEGRDAARWLQAKGIAAFVLKYRLQHKITEGQPDNLNEDDACKYGIADGIQAVKVVRAHAKQWHIAPDRVGIMGFSAGGMIASEVLMQQDIAARPDFAALVYGAPFGKLPAVPGKLPPVFMAWAQDDTTAGYAMVRFYKALTDAGNKPEALIFSAGGHGFGVGKAGTATADWLDEFYSWLQAQGVTRRMKN